MTRLTRRAFLLGTGTMAAAAVVRPRLTEAANPAQVGAWAPRVRLPHIAIHLAAMPGTGLTYMLYARGAVVGPGSLAWVTDLTTGQTTITSIPWFYDAMCGGGVIDDDGNIRTYGGRDPGADSSALFDITSHTWHHGPYLSQKKGAYYASAVRTGPIKGYPSGAIVIAFGRRTWIDAYDMDQYTIPEIPRLPASASSVAYAGSSGVYPRLMPLPDGTLCLAGPEPPLAILDVSAAKWTPVTSMQYGRRYEGCVTPVGLSGYEFFLTGGGGNPAAAAHNEIVNFKTGEIRTVAPPLIARKQFNAVLLPDGTILLMGGWLPTDNDNHPELYDPVADAVTLMAAPLPKSATDPSDQGPCVRGYHSTADLLDDGRVVWAGGTVGTKGFSYEIFSPPYLFKGPRPSLTLQSGAQVGYGGVITVSSPQAASIKSLVLMRPEHVSHGYNAGQQRHPLTFLVAGAHLVAQVPTSATALIPGWYRLFAVTQAGVPSLAEWVRVSK